MQRSRLLSSSRSASYSASASIAGDTEIERRKAGSEAVSAGTPSVIRLRDSKLGKKTGTPPWKPPTRGTQDAANKIKFPSRPSAKRNRSSDLNDVEEAMA